MTTHRKTYAMTVNNPLPIDGDATSGQHRALELLEAIAADRTVLDAWPTEERARLHQAIATIYHPEPKLRRKQAKVRER